MQRVGDMRGKRKGRWEGRKGEEGREREGARGGGGVRWIFRVGESSMEKKV